MIIDYSRHTDEQMAAAQADVLLERRPDIVALQEVIPSTEAPELRAMTCAYLQGPREAGLSDHAPMEAVFGPLET